MEDENIIEMDDNKTYRLVKMSEGIKFSQLTDRDLGNYKRLNAFDEDDILVVYENDKIVHIDGVL